MQQQERKIASKKSFLKGKRSQLGMQKRLLR
jgi:hypothetical protein